MPSPPKLLSRDDFRRLCYERDKGACVFCKAPAADPHHITDRKLFSNGGYYLDNAAAVCNNCHYKCETGVYTVAQVRAAAGITTVVVPPYLHDDVTYDKWGKAMFGLNDRIKYPKTMHLPWSPGLQNDDRVIQDLSVLEEGPNVITLKMDGENTTMYRDAIHARSIDTAFTHISRAWVRALHGAIRHEIPEGWRLCGENLYAEHSIRYEGLPSYFMLFSIWTEKNECLSWKETEEWAELLGLQTVPVLSYAPKVDNIPFTYDDLLSMAKLGEPPFYSKDVEGFVVRTLKGFHYDNFHTHAAKYVRKGHVQTDEHWMERPVIPNGMRK